MPEPTSVSDIKSEKFDDKDIIKCIKGTITKLFPAKSGEGTGGKWEYQNGEFKDDAGTAIEISFSKCSQPDSAKGKKVTIISVKSEQHGWQGVKVEDSSFKKGDETVHKRILKVTPSAQITYEGGAPGQSTGAGPSTGGAQQSRGPDTSLHPEPVLKDLIFLHSKVTDMVVQLYGGEGGKDAPFMQAAIATIYIEAAKNGLTHNFVERMNKPVPKQYPKPPSDPKDWDACVIPKGEFEGKTLKDLPDEKLRELYTALKKQSSETSFAKCVYQAADDRQIFKQEEKPKDPDLDPEPEDNLPF